MEDMALQEHPGFFSRFVGFFARDVDQDESPERTGEPDFTIKTAYRTTITVRRNVASFDDAMCAADGLRRGEQQILNLTGTDAAVRQKIVDFMCGVNYAQEGTWEEIGADIYLVVPASCYVDVATPSPRYASLRN